MGHKKNHSFDSELLRTFQQRMKIDSTNFNPKKKKVKYGYIDNNKRNLNFKDIEIKIHTFNEISFPGISYFISSKRLVFPYNEELIPPPGALGAYGGSLKLLNCMI